MAISCTGFQIESLRALISGEVARQDTADVDIERLKRDIELWTVDLRAAALADLARLCDEISRIENRVTALEGP